MTRVMCEQCAQPTHKGLKDKINAQTTQMKDGRKSISVVFSYANSMHTVELKTKKD
ncbi:MAG: hypothetical protein GY820_22340 [Gammaproteobacteria bacterium]|nr:hypothetical protein [Gammaproteobacteria bacterium]